MERTSIERDARAERFSPKTVCIRSCVSTKCTRSSRSKELRGMTKIKLSLHPDRRKRNDRKHKKNAQYKNATFSLMHPSTILPHPMPHRVPLAENADGENPNFFLDFRPPHTENRSLTFEHPRISMRRQKRRNRFRRNRLTDKIR